MKSPDQAFKDYTRYLKSLGKVELPLAIRGTMNQIAFEGRKRLSTVEMPKKFTLRNKFENQKTLHFEKSPNTFNVEKMTTSMGQMRVVRFAKGARATSDLFKQETGGTVRARPGSGMLRTPTRAARTSKSFNKPVARANRPSKGTDWPDLRAIERNMGVLRPRKFGRSARAMTWDARIRRAHMFMAKSGVKNMYVLPTLKNHNKFGAFKVVRGKPVMMHSLEKTSRKLKKRPTVKPAAEYVLKQTGNYFVKQASHRINRSMRKFAGI